jgi:hypothetical protein
VCVVCQRRAYLLSAWLVSQHHHPINVVSSTRWPAGSDNRLRHDRVVEEDQTDLQDEPTTDDIVNAVTPYMTLSSPPRRSAAGAMG